MKRPDRVTTEARLARMRGSIERVRAIRDRGAQPLADSPDCRSILERELQIALQACIDTGADLLIAGNGDVPATFADAFDKLGELGIVPVKLAGRLRDVADLRNHLVFRYLEDENPSRLLDRLEVLDEMEAFSRRVLDYLDASDASP